MKKIFFISFMIFALNLSAQSLPFISTTFSIENVVDGDWDLIIGNDLNFSNWKNYGKIELSSDNTLTVSDTDVGEIWYLLADTGGFNLNFPDSVTIISGVIEIDKLNYIKFEVVSDTEISAEIESIVIPPPPADWIDLRVGGDTFTNGNAATNQVRHPASMTMNRDADGMFFTGAAPWSSWVKFEYLKWNRGDDKRVQIILTNSTSAMMAGIGSNATSETSTTQYAQMEIQAFFNSANSLWGLYGNNGTIGTAANQNFTTALPANSTFKIVFEKDGEAQEKFYLYKLPSANENDWDDVSNLIVEQEIGTNMTADESTLMPVFIAANGGMQRFVSLSINPL